MKKPPASPEARGAEKPVVTRTEGGDSNPHVSGGTSTDRVICSNRLATRAGGGWKRVTEEGYL